MTKSDSNAQALVGPLAWIALTVSAIIAGIIWFGIYGAGTDLYETLDMGDIAFYASAIGVLVIVLDTWALSRGGKDRVVGTIALFTLLSPVIFFVLSNLIAALFVAVFPSTGS